MLSLPLALSLLAWIWNAKKNRSLAICRVWHCGRGRCAGRLRLISSIIGVDWIEECEDSLYNFETRNVPSSLGNKFATRHEAIGGERRDENRSSITRRPGRGRANRPTPRSNYPGCSSIKTILIFLETSYTSRAYRFIGCSFEFWSQTNPLAKINLRLLLVKSPKDTIFLSYILYVVSSYFCISIFVYTPQY